MSFHHYKRCGVLFFSFETGIDKRVSAGRAEEVERVVEAEGGGKEERGSDGDEIFGGDGGETLVADLGVELSGGNRDRDRLVVWRKEANRKEIEIEIER